MIDFTYLICIVITIFGLGVQNVENSVFNRGTPSNTSIGRIINGQYAVAHSFPWLVSLRILVGTRISTHFCAGLT